MNRTAVADVVAVGPDRAAAERAILDLLARARREGRAIAIGGARHSQGGQTIARDGLVLDMRGLKGMHLDEERDLLRVEAGARWADVLPYLNARGRSIAVMQSDHDFTIGGSLSVNCHGWQHDRPPISSTVEAIRLVTADGRVRRCSRTEEAELFSLALGGYGLFGVIVEAELRVVPNERYRLERLVVPVDAWRAAYRDHVTGAKDVGLVYSRLCVVPSLFLREAIVSIYRRVDGTSGGAFPLPEPVEDGVRRAVFLGSTGSDYGKQLRWDAEKRLEASVAPALPTRNELLHQTADAYLDRSAERTNILQEYFVPVARFEAFVERLRALLPGRADLMNITVRTVARDDDTTLRYADGELVALVMFFSQRRTAEADAAMAALTRELIDAALAEGGRHYLPYRLHATAEQLHRGYPMAPRFFEAKRRHDPEELFRNRFYEEYGRR